MSYLTRVLGAVSRRSQRGLTPGAEDPAVRNRQTRIWSVWPGGSAPRSHCQYTGVLVSRPLELTPAPKLKLSMRALQVTDSAGRGASHRSPEIGRAPV